MKQNISKFYSIHFFLLDWLWFLVKHIGSILIYFFLLLRPWFWIPGYVECVFLQFQNYFIFRLQSPGVGITWSARIFFQCLNNYHSIVVHFSDKSCNFNTCINWALRISKRRKLNNNQRKKREKVANQDTSSERKKIL